MQHLELLTRSPLRYKAIGFSLQLVLFHPASFLG
jgi:hypothetical protein